MMESVAWIILSAWIILVTVFFVREHRTADPSKRVRPMRPILHTEPYARFAQPSTWSDQGKELLPNEEAFALWVKWFRPEKDRKQSRGLGFDVIPPASYPAIVIYTRIRRQGGLTECEFFWDYVLESDFSAQHSGALE